MYGRRHSGIASCVSSALVSPAPLCVRYTHSRSSEQGNGNATRSTTRPSSRVNNSHYRSNTPQHFRNNTVSQRDIIKSFFTKKVTKTKELNAYLEEKFPIMHVPDAAQLMYSAALSNHILHETQLDKVVNILQTYATKYQPHLFHKYFYNPVHFSRLMYGLKMLHPQNRDISTQLSRLLTTLNSMLQLKNTTTFQNSGGPSSNNAVKSGNGSVISTNSGLFDARSFSMCLFGLQNMRINHATNGPVLLELIRKFREIALCLNDVDPYSLSYMIHGVKSLNTANADVQELLAVIINKAVHLKAEAFTYQLVCNNIAGLVRHDDIGSREASSLLHILTDKLQNCISDPELDANLMGVFFFHVQEMFSHSNAPLSDEALAFISTLTDKVEHSAHIPSPIQISNMLYASRNMNQAHAVVRRMQKVILYKAQQVRGKFSPRDISKCMSSLKHINIFESQQFVALLTNWFERGLLNKKKLNTKDLEACLYGLRHVKCNSEEVRKLIRVFAGCLQDTSQPLDASSVVHAFHFLRSSNCAHSEVQLFLSELNKKILTSDIKLNERQVNILFGLGQIQNPYPAIRPVVAMLSETWSPLPSLLPRVGLGFLGGLSGLDSEYPETRSLLACVVNDLKSNTFKLHHANDVSYSLRAAFSVLKNMTADHAEVREYMQYLTNELEILLLVMSRGTENSGAVGGKVSSVLPSSEINECMHILQGMRGEHKEVRDLAKALAQIDSSKGVTA